MHSHSHDHAHEHDHDHSHAHSHAHDHSHALSADADRRYLTVALVLILGFMAFEVVIGIVAHSLALISDAGHMLTDAGALILSLGCARRQALHARAAPNHRLPRHPRFEMVRVGVCGRMPCS